MTGAGATGSPQARFEDGLRLLAAALALDVDHRNGAAIVTAACGALSCFMEQLEAAEQRGLPDPDGEGPRLRRQLEALLTPRQSAEAAAQHALEAARLARDQAARVLPGLMAQ